MYPWIVRIRFEFHLNASNFAVASKPINLSTVTFLFGSGLSLRYRIRLH